MTAKVLILDTSVLCCWLRVPGKEQTGPRDDRWDHARIDGLLQAEQQGGSTFVLPLATLIETGNHIAQAPAQRYECAQRFVQYLRAAADEQSPWAAFTDQSSLWASAPLRALADRWPTQATAGLTLGDATIVEIAEYYAMARYQVEILTADQGLKAYEPRQPVSVPRRRR